MSRFSIEPADPSEFRDEINRAKAEKYCIRHRHDPQHACFICDPSDDDMDDNTNAEQCVHGIGFDEDCEACEINDAIAHRKPGFDGPLMPSTEEEE